MFDARAGEVKFIRMITAKREVAVRKVSDLILKVALVFPKKSLVAPVSPRPGMPTVWPGYSTAFETTDEWA